LLIKAFSMSIIFLFTNFSCLIDLWRQIGFCYLLAFDKSQ
jgi:hypothetical protein